MRLLSPFPVVQGKEGGGWNWATSPTCNWGTEFKKVVLVRLRVFIL